MDGCITREVFVHLSRTEECLPMDLVRFTLACKDFQLFRDIPSLVSMGFDGAMVLKVWLQAHRQGAQMIMDLMHDAATRWNTSKGVRGRTTTTVVDVPDDVVTSVAGSGDLVMTRLMLEHGASIPDRAWNNAVRRDNVQMVRLMLEHGAADMPDSAKTYVANFSSDAMKNVVVVERGVNIDLFS